MALPLAYNVRNVRQRWQVTLLAISGIAMVVVAFVVLCSMAIGFRTALRSTGLRENALVVQRGSASEMSSWVPLAHRTKLMVDERIARGADGQPLASPEIVVITGMPRRTDGEPTNVTVRGVTARAFEVRGGIEIVEGRRFTPGLQEVIVGERIAERVRGLLLGAEVSLQKKQNQWKVVGVFRSRGGAFESEIWGDLETMGPAFQRTAGSNALVVRLKDPATLAAFDRDVRANPEMQLRAVEERKYYDDQNGQLAMALLALALFVSVVMGIGAVFGAMNTMNAIVAARTREIGTLRALGFSRSAVLVSFVVESTVLAVAGGLIGVLLALPAHGFTTGTGQTAGFAEIAFAFRITPGLMGLGLVFATVMGIVGGLLPAARAARLPITAALREN